MIKSFTLDISVDHWERLFKYERMRIENVAKKHQKSKRHTVTETFYTKTLYGGLILKEEPGESEPCWYTPVVFKPFRKIIIKEAAKW